MSYEDQQPQQKTPAPHAASIGTRGAARRRFARAGLGVTGALVTITSRAGMTCEVCKSPSGSLSGGLTSHHGPPPVCVGRSPGYWKTHSSWPCSRDIAYGLVFSCSPYTKYAQSTLGGILVPQKWDKHGLGRHMVATYLNIISGKISFLKVTQLQTMWNEVHQRGYYNPTAGVKWYAADVVRYLQRTML